MEPNQASNQTLGVRLAPLLPFFRRYARALTGSQRSGDAYVRATLSSIVAAPHEFPDGDTRVALFTMFQRIWTSTAVETALEQHDDAGAQPVDQREAVSRARLAMLAPSSRQILLLHALEGFSAEQVASIVDAPITEVRGELRNALNAIETQTRTTVLIIEDEPIIAMDIESIVNDLGHDVVGVAVTRHEAVAMARTHRPGLVLADIQLADDSSGIDAVDDILRDITVPVIFITAFPERLLTGERVEPTFLITKPFQESTVRATIAQALFFNDATVAVSNEQAVA
ncbi:MAG: response regulator [Sphingopyxis sp.]|nr:response regulator [Sphingopyxis sp.]